MATRHNYLCRLPSETYKALQTKASEEGRSINSIVVDAVEIYLADNSPADSINAALYSSTRSVLSSTLSTYAAASGSSVEEAIKQLAGTVEVTTDDIQEESGD